MNKKLMGILAIAAVLALGWFWWSGTTQAPAPVPAEVVWVNADPGLITYTYPQPGQTVPQKFQATGSARGYWYFEASFPAEVLDKDGRQLVIAPAQAQGEWMTEDYVPYNVLLDVGTYTGAATLVLHRDNPSGDPTRDASARIPIIVQ